MEILGFLKSNEQKKIDLVSRLLDAKNINAKEAALLLNGTQTRISIAKIELSSGAKFAGNDLNDNETRRYSS